MSSNLSNIIAEGNEEITRIKSIAQNLYDENTKMKSIVHNSQEQHEILLKKEVQIFNLMEDKKALEEKLRISRNEFQDQKVNIWHLEAEVKDYKKAAIENSNAYKEEQQRRTEANIREVNALEKLAHWESEMKEELAKRDRAETRRFLKERSQVRISPNNYRRFSHVSPIVERTPVVQEYVPGPPYEFLTRQSIRNPSGTINTSKNESLRRKANTNTPKTIAKSQRGKKNEVDYNGKPADKFLKVLGITSAIGLVGMAGERGYLW